MNRVIIGFIIVYTVYFFMVMLTGCGQEPVAVPTDRVVEVPANPTPTVEPIDIAGLYVSDENGSEVTVYSDGEDVYVAKIHLEFTNSYGGIDYLAYIDLTSGFYNASIDNRVETLSPVFKVSQITTTTNDPTELLYYVSNYTTTPSYHKAYLTMTPTASSLKVRIKFNGSSYYRNGLVYFDREFEMRRAQ